VGQWLELEATLRIDADQAKVMLLGPAGEPVAIPTQRTGPRVRARFAAASPGRWLVQVLATGETGPLPVIEAVVFADVSPSAWFHAEPAPGETPLGPDESPTDALTRMVTALRSQTGRPPLLRDPSLDLLAQAHARAMRTARHIGHDLGEGSTHHRLSLANVRARLAGENVAHASSPERVHRALWRSPSHRTNLLHRGFSRWGLGVAQDEVDGSLWVCELFASQD
jgi:uncharacterized protein YkwD